VLSTSPFAPRTHWDQIYLPLLEPIAAQAGDTLALDIVSETGGDAGGIGVRWSAQHQRGDLVTSQTLDIGAGYLA
jgi:protein arginine N-methyltransferase 1